MDNLNKSFACKFEKCESRFTTADHLEAHSKVHISTIMVLQLGLCEESAMFGADQTPTPTRLIRNCDEVGLFDDLHLHHVNPFEETFRRAVETKSMEDYSTQITKNDELKSSTIVEDTLHTPCVLPLVQGLRSKDELELPSKNKEGDEAGSSDKVCLPDDRAKRKNVIRSSPCRTNKLRRVLPKFSPSIVPNVPQPVNSRFLQNPNQIKELIKPVERKSVCEILKEQILKARTSTNMQSIVHPPQKDNRTKPSQRKQIHLKDESQHQREHNRESAKRYRNKMKQWNDETKLKNIKLEEENRRLKEELSQLKAILQIHQHCSISKALSLGHSIPIGPPKVIFKSPTPSNHSPSNTKSPNLTDSESEQMYLFKNSLNGLSENQPPNN